MNEKNDFFINIFVSVSSLVLSHDSSRRKKLFQDIAEIKATLKVFMEQTDKRFKGLREDMNKRFEQVNKRFDQMMNFL